MHAAAAGLEETGEHLRIRRAAPWVSCELSLIHISMCIRDRVMPSRAAKRAWAGNLRRNKSRRRTPATVNFCLIGSLLLFVKYMAECENTCMQIQRLEE